MKQKKTFSKPPEPRRKGGAEQKGRVVSAKGGLRVEASAPDGRASREADASFDAWWAKYGPVESAIVSSQERRRSRAMARRRARAREFGDLCELTDGDAVRWKRDGLFAVEELLLDAFRDPGYLAFLDIVRRGSGERVSRLKAKVRRPSYYAAENARRRALAAERRKVRARRTDNACPTREQVLDAWIARRKSHEDAIRFGSLVEDLECYIDNSLLRDEDGVIVGRNPGVKGWLRENVPALALQYTTVMRYKAAAKKLKQVTELADPTPMDVVLAPKGVAAEGEKQDYGADEIAEGEKRSLLKAKGGVPPDRVAGGKPVGIDGRVPAGIAGEPPAGVLGGPPDGVAEGAQAGIAGRAPARVLGGPPDGVVEVPSAGDGGLSGPRAGSVGRAEVPSVEVVRARAIWEEVVKGAGRSATALFERLDALTDPERVEDANMLAAWREKYANEITVRTKRTWWLKRLWKRTG